MNQAVNVVFIADESGIEGAVIAIKSVLYWSEFAAIHVIDMGMSRASLLRLAAISSNVKTVAVSAEISAWLATFSLHGNPHVSRAAYAKLQLHRLLPDIDKVVYLDIDTLSLCDVGELFSVELDSDMVGVTWTAFQVTAGQERLGLAGRYFNSGVMLCQLNLWRENCVEDQFSTWYQLHHGRMKFNDQEILNGVFDSRNREIGKRWNVTHWELFRAKTPIGVALEDVAVLHFNGSLKHWHPDYEKNMKLDEEAFSAIRQFLLKLQ